MRNLNSLSSAVRILVASALFCTAMLYTKHDASADSVTGNLLLNPGCEDPLVGGEIPGWVEVAGSTWQPRTGSTPPHTGSAYFYPGAIEFAELAQDVSLATWSSEIAQGRVSIYARDYIRSFPQSPADDCRLRLQLRNSPFTTTYLNLFSPWTENTSGWQLLELSIIDDFNPAATVARIGLMSDRDSGTNNDGFHDTTSLQVAVGSFLTLQSGLTFPDAYQGADVATVPVNSGGGTNRGEVAMTEGSPSEVYTGVSREVVQHLLLDGVGGSPQTEITLSNMLNSQPFTSPAGEDTLYVGLDRAALFSDQVPGTYEGVVRFRISDSHLGIATRSNWVQVPVTMTVLPCTNAILYVDADAPPDGDGMSWATARNELHDSLSPETCLGNPAGIEIRVAEGIYTPHASDRNASFDVAPNMMLSGGYAGFGEPDPDAWDPDTYVTILSGDLNGDDFARGKRGVMNAENSYNVVTVFDVSGVVIEGITISSGNANGGGTPTNQGGGLYVAASGPLESLTLNEVHFIGNHAENHGGAIFHQRAIVATDCSFTTNTTNANGGAVDGFGYASPVSTWDTCAFTSNTAAQYGGAISFSDDNDFINCTFDSNLATAIDGGALAIWSGSTDATIDTCQFDNNSAGNNGGAISVLSGALCDILNSMFTSNDALGNDGGAVSCILSTIDLDDCDFEQNSAFDNGGAVYVSGATATIDLCKFDTNTATGSGGALFELNTQPVVTNSDFIGNSANEPGGAIFCLDGGGNFTDCTFESNDSGDVGGACHHNNTVSLFYDNCTFDSNTSTINGGAVSHTTGSDATYTHCIFVNNTAQNDGGGLRIEDCTVNVHNCLIISNNAGDGAGVLVEAPDGDGIFRNCTFAHNDATGVGGGIRHATGTTSLVTNSIFWGNTGAASPTVFNEQIDLDGSASYFDNCIEGWDGNFGPPAHGANPLFLDPDGLDNILGTLDDDYRLDHRSLCIDFGDDAMVPGGLTEDILGNPRIVNCVDMGAVEHDGIALDMIDFGCDANSTVACFSGIGDLPGSADWSWAYAVSDNGEVIAAMSYSAGFGGNTAAIATVSGIAGAPDGFNGLFEALSADGSIGVGQMAPPLDLAFTWTACDGFTTLADIAGGIQDASAEDLSADGTIVVGEGRDASGNIALKWTGGGAPQSLGELPGGQYFSSVRGCSSDASVIVGVSIGADGPEAVSWTNDGPPLGLGDITGGNFNSTAYDVSDNGTVIVGSTTSADGLEACIFDSTGFEEPTGLGDLAGGAFQSIALAISGSGDAIVGFGTSDSGSRAFLYTDWTGMIELHDILESKYGLDLTGWTLTRANTISADGLTIVGEGLNPSGDHEGWIVHLPQLPPCPTDVVPAPLGNGAVDVFDLLELLANWGANGPGADIAEPLDVVDVFDLLDLLSNWGPCPGP